MSGLGFASLAQYREPKPTEAPGEDADVDLDDLIVIDPSKPNAEIKLANGDVVVNIGTGMPRPAKALDDVAFEDNLADSIAADVLSTIAEDLLRGIEEDDLSRREWLEERAEGIKLLALKIDKPSQSGTSDASSGTLSRVRDPMLLKAVLQAQATASGELLPVDGPVKVENITGSDTLEDDPRAQLLEDDMNYFVTQTATEYYPDTEKMLFWTIAGGSGFKKVYRCPIKQRPTSEMVDAANLIISNGASDLQNAERVTEVVKLSQSTMKRMVALGAYREIDLGAPTEQPKNVVEEQKEDITGIRVSSRPEDVPFTVYECYCMIVVPGDEHKAADERVDGLPRPYKVSIDLTSRQVLEVRRNWKQDDKLERRRKLFVKYPFVPAFGFYDIGLINIAGNPALGSTALLRIINDGAILSNFPGGLIAKSAERQNTVNLRVGPGDFAQIDTSSIADGDIRKAVMPLPYHEPGPAIIQLWQELRKIGLDTAGAAEISVGEGKQDAPVGTTIALLEQSTKVMDAVHKRMHRAQGEEFQLLRDLFRQTPEDFWRFQDGKPTSWDKEKLLKALNDYNFVPKSDPNTSSHMQRVMRGQALYQMAMAAPQRYNLDTVELYVLQNALRIKNPEQFMAPQGAAPPPDPKAQASLIGAQADMLDAQTKSAKVAFDNKNATTEDENRDLDRQSAEKIAAMNLQKEVVIHSHDAATERAMHSQGLASEHALQTAQHGHEVRGKLIDHALTPEPVAKI